MQLCGPRREKRAVLVKVGRKIRVVSLTFDRSGNGGRSRWEIQFLPFTQFDYVCARPAEYFRLAAMRLRVIGCRRKMTNRRCTARKKGNICSLYPFP